jgi:hypothetical protein
MSPPDKDIGVGQHVLRESVLGLGQRGCADHDVVAEVLGDPFGDGGVHSLRVELRDVRLHLLVHVLTPDQDTDRARGRGG